MPIIEFNECVGDCFIFLHNFSPFQCQFLSMSLFLFSILGITTSIFLIWFFINAKVRGIKWKIKERLKKYYLLKEERRYKNDISRIRTRS